MASVCVCACMGFICIFHTCLLGPLQHIPLNIIKVYRKDRLITTAITHGRTDVLLHPTAMSFTQDTNVCMAEKHQIPLSLTINPHLHHPHTVDLHTAFDKERPDIIIDGAE